MNAALRTAFNAAIDSAVIDSNSLRLSGGKVFVTIGGREWSAPLYVRDVPGVQDALRRCLADYCAVEAVASVVNPA